MASIYLLIFHTRVIESIEDVKTYGAIGWSVDVKNVVTN